MVPTVEGRHKSQSGTREETMRVGLERWTVALFASATLAAITAPVAARANPVLAVLAVAACLAAAAWTARVLPGSLDGAFRRRPVVAGLWVLLALAGVLQMGRLSAFMADSRREWGATVPDPAAIHHQCLAAYVYAADLDRRGERNLYDAGWYPVFDPAGDACRLVETTVKGLPAWVEDAYEYPPPFLMLPRAALAFGGSLDAIRAWWFLLRALALVAAGVMLARWIGGGEGLVLGLLLPAVLASLETMFDLQWGQFHAMAMLLACAAMVAFDSRRAAVGGALLAAAILAKLFPAVLLVTLLARREWRALAWTAAFGAALSILGLFVLGAAPYAAFFGYQLPRLASGAAFAFTHLGRNAVFLLSRNFSTAAVADKLAVLGAPAVVATAARAVRWAHLLALVPLAALASRPMPSRALRALSWLALLDLAALCSPVAPSVYVLAPVLWVLALMATQVRGRGRWAAAIVLGWIVVVGPPPLPDRVDLVVGLVSQALVVALCVAAMIVATRGTTRGAPEVPAA
jgi:hypothetical protein